MTRAPLVLGSIAWLPVLACAGEPQLGCNTDADCGTWTCSLGTCVAPEGDAARLPREGGPGEDAPVDGDPHEGGEGEGEGDGGCSAWTSAWLDEDGDGFTGAQTAWCADDALPAGASWEPRHAPIHLVEPQDVDAAQGQWDVQALTFHRSNASPVGRIVLRDFACAGTLDTVAGLELFVTLDHPAGPATEVRVAIEAGGAMSNERVEVVTASDAQLQLGGANDTFGLALTPAQVCAPDFALHITVAPESGNGAALSVRAAGVFAYGAQDCDDEDDQAFSPAELRVDADLDGAAGGLRLPACIGLTLPAGRGVRDLDCAPDDAAAYPGQEQRFARARFGVGGYDFDCDGDEEALDPVIEDMSSCTLDEAGTSCQVWYAAVSPACGETVSYGDCRATCTVQVRQFTQLCR